MEFVDEDGSIIVPKSVRPIIEYSQTALGSSSGALRQFRAGKLHIREYGSHYSVHSDKIDPQIDPLGHLIVDAPEYLVGMLSGISVYSIIRESSINHSKRNSANSSSDSVLHRGGDYGLSPYVAGIFSAYTGYRLAKSLKKLSRGRC